MTQNTFIRIKKGVAKAHFIIRYLVSENQVLAETLVMLRYLKTLVSMMIERMQSPLLGQNQLLRVTLF